MRTYFRSWQSIALAALAIASLNGCASFGRGIGEGIASREQADTRQCWARGRPVEGVMADVQRQEAAEAAGVADRPTLKVLMVHGIGSHAPGYSTRLAENMARALALDHVQEKFREFELSNPALPGKGLGVLRVTRHLNGTGTREMLFYELTWDPTVEAEKQTIAFDNSGEHSFRRTAVNNALKYFVNDTVPDVLVYNGRFREPIQMAVGQSLCWMMSNTWGELPDGGVQYCDALAPTGLSRIQDDFVFITHSLGSRITADALQRIASLARTVPDFEAKTRGLQEKRSTVFMLSNQLPLLQLGREEPEVRGQIDAVCAPGSPRAGERLFGETRLVAFSDPNDLFSYAIPPKFLDEHLDSRLCPTLTNVILNVTPVTNVLGLGEFANPMAAHVGYDNDERVIELMVRGIGTDAAAPVVKERCEWIEAVPEGKAQGE
ncbi:MAG: hypothetical protein P1P84_15485 [Deferrisomatales bacterium]|nr:hypothetical protein [Deferrisomatales bacterium]